MLTLQISNELEAKLRILAEREQITPELFVHNLIKNVNTTKDIAFFSYAGLWQDRDIFQQTLREKSWGGNEHTV